MTIVLFDVDGTLISQGSSGHWEAFLNAVEDIYGISFEQDRTQFYGMVDQQILITGLSNCGLDQQTIMDRIEDCKESMIEHFTYLEDIKAQPGAIELLRALEESSIPTGLITGNLEPIARRKMTYLGLNNHFPFGGFGDTGINRADVVREAVQDAERHLARKAERYIVVGDTPRDIAAAQENGLEAIGVATGAYSLKELHNADLAVKDLRDRKILDFVLQS